MFVFDGDYEALCLAIAQKHCTSEMQLQHSYFDDGKFVAVFARAPFPLGVALHLGQCEYEVYEILTNGTRWVWTQGRYESSIS